MPAFGQDFATTGYGPEDQAIHNAMPPVSPPGPLPEPFRIGSPRNQGAASGETTSKAAALYRQLRDIHLDPQQVYRIREASIEREDVHIVLEDGVAGFTQAVGGRITGMFFEGEGEVLLIPPDRVEKRSLGLFIKAGILEEKFTTAYFRFNDDFADELMEYSRGKAEDPDAFVAQWNNVVNSLSETDALRLMTSALNGQKDTTGKWTGPKGDHMLRARFSGKRLGIFDLFFDTDAREQISAGQLARDGRGRSFFNVWTAFPMRSMRVRGTTRRAPKGRTASVPAVLGSTNEEEPEDRLHITDYKIKLNVKPPTDIEADCTMSADVIQGGQRVILFELSRNLRVSSVEYNGKTLDFLQNEALEGTALERRGNDLIALVFPESLQTGQKLQLRFVYGGSVMLDAGAGLLYVGARGIWYPNRGVAMANFDLEFTYPPEWTLVATGHKHPEAKSPHGMQVSRWLSSRPIPLAGFNLGHYERAEARAGNVPIEVYAGNGVENTMVASSPPTVLPPVFPAVRQTPMPIMATEPEPSPSPSENAQKLAHRVRKGVESLEQQLGPYPFDSLVISQMPGPMSQGWPGLIFLSSYSFLSRSEMEARHIKKVDTILFESLVPIHESAHQWWGDLVTWKGYRDQWLVEALANYCALVAIEKSHPDEVEEVLDDYRRQLLQQTADGFLGADAGPVTLGVRLFSSEFPNGYPQISYGRGTWLLHMLRNMLRDAEQKDAKFDPKAAKRAATGGEPFFRVLRKLRERYEGRAITNHIVQQVFEEEVPESLRFDGRKSLDWFFDEWVNGTAIPHIESANVKVATTAQGVVVTGKLLQKEAPPELITSVPVYGVKQNKSLVLLGQVFADGEETPFRLKAPAGVKKIEIDPYETVLRRK